jgi:hypothetical protein
LKNTIRFANLPLFIIKNLHSIGNELIYLGV